MWPIAAKLESAGTKLFVLTNAPEVRDCNKVGQTLILTCWLLIWPCFLPKIAKTAQKVIVFFLRNGEEIGHWFYNIWIARWINFFLKKVLSFFDIGHLQGVKWGQNWTKSANFRYLPFLQNLYAIFRRFFKQCFSLLEYYLMWKLQQNRTVFEGVRSQKPCPKRPFHRCWTDTKNFENLYTANHKSYTDQTYHDHVW